MATPIILSDNRFLDGTPTATDTATGYDILFIRDGKSFTSWKAASSGAKYLKVDCGSGVQKAVNTLGVAFHNLYTAKALVLLQYSQDDSVWNNVDYQFTFVSDRPRLVTFTKTYARYWRLYVYTASVAAQIGELMIGERVEFPYPPETPFAPFVESAEAESSRSKVGHLLGSIVRFKPQTTTVTFRNILRSWVDGTYMPWWENYGSDRKPFFFAWDIDTNPADVEFVRVTNDFTHKTDLSIGNYVDSLSLELESVKSTASAPASRDWWYREGLIFHAPFDDYNTPLKINVGQGSFTFTRATIATYINPRNGYIEQVTSGTPRIEADGILIESQKTNLLLRSEEFSNASWTKTGGDAVADQAYGCMNTLTADLIREDTSTGNHKAAQTFTMADSTQYTFSVYLKANSRTCACLKLTNKAGNTYYQFFNILTGAKGDSASTGGISASCSSEIYAGPGVGWWRCSITIPSQTGATTPNAEIRIATGTTTGTDSYTGLGTSYSIIAWGAQAETASISSYIPTTSGTVQRNADDLSISTSNNFARYYGSIASQYKLAMNVWGIPGVVGYSGAGQLLAIGSSGFNQYVNDGTTTISSGDGSAFDRVTHLGASRWGFYGGLYLSTVRDGGTIAQGNYDGDMGDAGTLYVGSFGGSYYINGNVKNFRLFNRALTDAEMIAITRA